MRIKRPFCAFSLVFMLIVWLMTLVRGGVDITEKAPDRTKVTVDGVIEDKEYKNEKWLVYIKCNAATRGRYEGDLYEKADGNTGGESRGSGEDQNGALSGRSYVKYIVYLDGQSIEDFRIGQTVRVNGTYSNFAVAENAGQFCMRKYYRIKGYEARITKAKITHCSTGYSVYKDFLYNVKERTKCVYKDNMSPQHSGTLTAMVLGDKTGLDEDTKSLFQNAGISHILSLSGLHIASVGLFVFSLFIKAGLGTRLSSVLSVVVMTSYGVMTGLSTSTFRALIMFLLGIGAKCIGRTYDLLSAVSVSAVIILVENPLYIYDSGFLMSFLSVAGIGIIYPVLNEVTEELCKQDAIMKLFDGVRQSVCISLAASLATLPVVMSSFYKLSRYSIFVNIIIVPVMGVVLLLGIAGGMTGFPVVRNAVGAVNAAKAGVVMSSADVVSATSVLGAAKAVKAGAAVGTSAGYWTGNVLTICLHKISSLLLRCAEHVLGFFNRVSAFSGSIPGNTWVTGKPATGAIIVYIILILVTFSGVGKPLSLKLCKLIYKNDRHKNKPTNPTTPNQQNPPMHAECLAPTNRLYEDAFHINSAVYDSNKDSANNTDYIENSYQSRYTDYNKGIDYGENAQYSSNTDHGTNIYYCKNTYNNQYMDQISDTYPPQVDITNNTGNVITYEKQDNEKHKKAYMWMYRIVTFVLVFVAVFAISYRNDNDFSIDVLSIGQGACNVIHGADVPVVIIDAGSSDVKDAGKYRVIPNLLSKGISEIDYLFVTHPDDDHINAEKELLSDKTSGIKVKAVVFSIVDNEIMGMFKEYGVPVYSFNEGQVIANNKYEIKAVYPACREGMSWKNIDANENSLVLKITHRPSGFTALFTGDIGKQAEGEILSASRQDVTEQEIALAVINKDIDATLDNQTSNTNINKNSNTNIKNHNVNSTNISSPNIDSRINDHIKNGSNYLDNIVNTTFPDIRDISFMTIAHHGSKNSSSEEFLSYANPLICTISAGKDNRYGHPHQTTLDKLNTLQIPYLITYETGEISVKIDKGKVWVERFLN